MNHNHKKLKSKIQRISIRSVGALICASLITSCVTPTYPISTHQSSSYHDPTIPIIAGVATVGAIAYYADKKKDKPKHNRIKYKPIAVKPVKVTKPIKSHYKPRHVVSARPHANNKPARNSYTNTDSRRIAKNSHTQARSSRHTSTNRQRTIADTRNQLTQKRNDQRNSVTPRNSSRNTKQYTVSTRSQNSNQSQKNSKGKGDKNQNRENRRQASNQQ